MFNYFSPNSDMCQANNLSPLDKINRAKAGLTQKLNRKGGRNLKSPSSVLQRYTSNKFSSSKCQLSTLIADKVFALMMNFTSTSFCLLLDNEIIMWNRQPGLGIPRKREHKGNAQAESAEHHQQFETD